MSDKQYVENLASIHIKESKPERDKDEMTFCANCGTNVSDNARYCTLCGMKQGKEHRENITVQSIRKYNPLNSKLKPNSYQFLTIIAGLSVILPTLFIVARIEPLLIAIDYEIGRDMSNLTYVFIFLGILSSLLSCIAITVSFAIKNSRTVGRILFFLAFAIIITSIMVGIVGFVLFLFASKNAYKKRYY